MNRENINDDQIRWEFLKYKVRKFSRKFSKTLAKELREKLRILENKLKLYKQNSKCFENEDYLRYKLRFEEIYKTKENGVNPIQDGPFWGCSRMGGGLPKICHTYPTMMKLGTVIPYLKKTPKIYESRDTPLEFC